MGNKDIDSIIADVFSCIETSEGQNFDLCFKMALMIRLAVFELQNNKRTVNPLKIVYLQGCGITTFIKWLNQNTILKFREIELYHFQDRVSQKKGYLSIGTSIITSKFEFENLKNPYLIYVKNINNDKLSQLNVDDFIKAIINQ